MAYTKTTLSQTIANVKADLASRFPSLDASIPNSNSENLAEVIAASENGSYGYIDYILAQFFVSTADDEWLDLHATENGMTRSAATKADGDVVMTASIGSTIDTGDELISSAGSKYTVDTGFTFTSASESHSVTAETAGEDGNIDADGSLTFVSPPTGVDSAATVDTGGITGGTDRESNDDLRTRILAKKASPPMGGKEDDYKAWAIEATDVTRSWVHPDQDGDTHGDTIANGTVWLYFAMDDTYADDGGIPASGDVDDVQDYIDPLRPVDMAGFLAIAPIAQEVDFELSITPSTTTTQAATTAEITSAITNNGGVGTTISVSAFYEAMSRVADLTDWSISTIDSATPADVTSAAGYLHTTGSITYL